MTDTTYADAVVIGAGFGGIGAALTLAEAGLNVVVLEAMNYPGGCASTFQRGGYRYETGATVHTGFQQGQLFNRWIERHRLPLDVQKMDPGMRIRLNGRTWVIPSSKEAWVETLVSEAGVDGARVRKFMAMQEEVSTSLWSVLDEPSLLPPLSGSAVAAHAYRTAKHVGWMRFAGRPLHDVMDAYGVAHVSLLRQWIDATVRVTVQSSVARVEAPFGLAAMDFPFRGIVHLPGGIDTLSTALLNAARRLGARVNMSTAAWKVRPHEGAWRVESRRGIIDTPLVFSNLLPSVLSELVGEPVLPGLTAQVKASWGAAMQYLLVAEDEQSARSAMHYQVVADPDAALEGGNHALISVGDVQEGRHGPVRAVTVSTHIDLAGDPATHVTRVEAAQSALLDRVNETFPAWNIVSAMPASPRTFERFTGRKQGFVGGIPRHVGLHHYRRAFAGPVKPGLYLVGDSTFPGQGTLACATGGQRAAIRALKDIGWKRTPAKQTA